MLRGIPNISIPNLSYSAAHSGKMSLPVDPASLIYSHFEHVSGVAAPKGTQGVAISKLNLLDVLIGQLNQVRRGGAVRSPGTRIPSEVHKALPEKRLDVLIENLGNQIRQAKAASAAMPYIPSPSAQSGAVFSLVA